MYTLSLHDALPIYLKTPGRPRTPWDFWGEIAAAETPHGASLQWGAPAVETDKLTPMPLAPLPSPSHRPGEGPGVRFWAGGRSDIQSRPVNVPILDLTRLRH